MMKTTSMIPKSLVILAIATIPLIPGSSLAEVGTFSESLGVGSPYSPYIIFGVSDDPHPFGNIWSPTFAPDVTHNPLNPGGTDNGDGRPSLVMSEISGQAHVAWARNSAEGFDIVLSSFDGAAWSEWAVLAGDTSVDELDPHLSVDPINGTVHMFYWVNDAVPRVMHRQAPADLSSWSDPVRVSGAGEAACRPAGVVHAGELYVAYEVHGSGYGSTPRDVILAVRGAGGFEPEVVAVTHMDGKVVPEVHSHTGTLWVDWVDAADEIAWTRFNTQTGWEPLQYEPYTSVEDRELHARNRVRVQAAH